MCLISYYNDNNNVNNISLNINASFAILRVCVCVGWLSCSVSHNREYSILKAVFLGKSRIATCSPLSSVSTSCLNKYDMWELPNR